MDDAVYEKEKEELATPSSSSGTSTPFAMPTPQQRDALPAMEPNEPKLPPTDLERQQTGASYYISQHLSLPSEITFIAVICSAQLLTQIGFGQTLLPSQIIGASLGATSPGQLSWTLAAYSLTVGTFVLPAGRLGDIFGSKKMVVLGWAWYAVWSVVAGLAIYAPRGQGRVVMFSVCQALRGIGPAFLLPNALAIAGRSYPNGKRKNMVFATFAMCAPVGGVMGGVFGSIFAQLSWWPWIFFSTGLACAALGVVALMVIPADSKAEPSTTSKQSFDLIGSVLGVSGLVLFNFAWNQAAVVGWATAYVPTLLAVGVLIMVGFYFYERRVAQPILPPSVFNLRSTAVLSVVAFGWSSFGIFFYYTIAFLINIRGLTPLGAAAQNSTVVPAGIIAAGLTGICIKRVPAPWLMCIAGAAFMIGSCLVAFMPVHRTFWIQTFIAFIITPFG